MYSWYRYYISSWNLGTWSQAHTQYYPTSHLMSRSDMYVTWGLGKYISVCNYDEYQRYICIEVKLYKDKLKLTCYIPHRESNYYSVYELVLLVSSNNGQIIPKYLDQGLVVGVMGKLLSGCTANGFPSLPDRMWKHTLNSIRVSNNWSAYTIHNIYGDETQDTQSYSNKYLFYDD